MHRARASHILRSIALALVLPLAARAAAESPAAANGSQRDDWPRCVAASHDRLVIRKGRDVCAGSLGSGGRPVAAGYVPTSCAAGREIYRIDFKGLADRCLRSAEKQGS